MYKNINGVPDFEEIKYKKKTSKYCLLIPVINEGNRIKEELKRAKKAKVSSVVDIVICDGGSTDNSLNKKTMQDLNVNTVLIKKGPGKQGAQLRMGFYWALIVKKYEGIVTVDGNNKDSIEDVEKFINKLEEGYDFIQGSRFINGGKAINTPVIRLLSVKLLHAPIISLTARKRFTDTTNAFRGYSKKYLLNDNVKPFRDIFNSYELLAYLSVKASQIGLKTCEIPVTREYPKKGKVPTKISFFKGNFNLLAILFKNMFGCYNVKKGEK